MAVRKTWLSALLGMLLALAALHCGPSTVDGDGDVDADSDTDVDSDSDADPGPLPENSTGLSCTAMTNRPSAWIRIGTGVGSKT